MRTLKDRERLTLLSKVFCEIYGPLTSNEILNLIKGLKSIRFAYLPNNRELSMILVKNPNFVAGDTYPRKFKVKE